MKKSKIYIIILVLVFVVLVGLVIFAYFDGLKERLARAALTDLEISEIPSSVAQSAGETVTITAKDGGAVMEDYGGTVTFTSTDGTATLPSDYTFKNGTKEKAISLNGWNDQLKANDYTGIVNKLSTNNISNIYVSVFEPDTTQVAAGNLYCENDFAFPGVTSSDHYDLNDLITAATAAGIDVYAWNIVFGPEQHINIDGDSNLENTWVDPASSEHLTFMNNLTSHLLTNYGGLKGVVIDYIRYADAPASNRNDGDNIDEAEYRVFGDSGSYTDYTGPFAPGNAITVISNVVQSIAATVGAFPGKEIAAETFSTASQSSYDNWIKANLGQDYALMAANLDFIIPLAYHIGYYGPDWVADVVDFVYSKVNPANPACEVWPKVQTWQSGAATERPGPGEIEETVEPIDYAKVGGLGFYEYGHTSDDEWAEAKDSFDDNGVKTFSAEVFFGQTGTFNLKVEDEVAVKSDTQSNITVFEGHPNGALLKAPNSPTVWYLSNGYRYSVPSVSVFNSRFDWGKVVKVSSSEIASYQTDPSRTSVRCQEGTLLKRSGVPTVYVVENGNKRPINSASTFIGKGYKWSNIVTVENQNVLNVHPTGTVLTAASSLPNGTLVKSTSSATVYFLENGTRRVIDSVTVFNSQFRWSNIVIISSGDLNSYPLGKRIHYSDSSLVKNSGSATIYHIASGKKRFFSTASQYLGLGYDWSDCVTAEGTSILRHHEATTTGMSFLLKYVMIYGDSRTGHTYHQQVVNRMVNERPFMVLHTGDLVNNGNLVSDWNIFNSITSELRANAKFYPSLGNHEYNSSLYYDNFILPGNERYYSFERDNIHYIALDSNLSLSAGSDQYNWLQSDLAGIGASIKFTVVFFHHPPCGGLTDAVALFEANGVDIVFNGHSHLYARMVSNGIYYVISGGGGAPLASCPVCSYSTCNSTYAYVRLLLTDNKLDLKVFDINGSQIDAFEVTGI